MAQRIKFFRVARLCLGGCGCVALLLVAQPALARSVPPSGQLLWSTPKGFVLTNPLGGGSSALPALPASIQPLWVDSPSGSTLMIGSDTLAGGLNLFLWDVNTGRSRLLATFPGPEGVSSPAYEAGGAVFSPDGKTIAFAFTSVKDPGTRHSAEGDGVIFMSVANGHKIRSINIPGADPGAFQWLPDGRLLVSEGEGLETVSKTGTGARPVNISLPPGDTQRNTVLVSPDGSEVAMQVDKGDGCWQEGPCNSGVYLAPMAGGTAIRLASAESDSGFVWSPDGKFLIYLSPDGTNMLMTVATRHTITIHAPKGRTTFVVGWLPA